MLAPGQAHDLTCAEPLLETVDPRALLGDKAFDADPFIGSLARRGITPVIPPKANRKAQLRLCALLRAQPHRTLLQQAQALSRHRHTLR
jgi:hypothetical protein